VHDPAMLGFLRYHHLGPKPSGYLYPYPDFLQMVYVARAGEDRPEGTVHDDYVTRSLFSPGRHPNPSPAQRRPAVYRGRPGASP
jgi:hypothetical protein